MALSRAKNIPKDGVSLSEFDAIAHVWNTVSDWDLSESWALRYGGGILGGYNVISSIFINNHFRSKVKLGRFGYFSSFIPITILPCVFTVLFHRHVITTNILLMKREDCPVCYEIKSAVIQCGFGLVYPIILAPVSAFMLANQYHTYRLPSLLNNRKELFQVWKKMARPLTANLTYFTAIGVLLSSVITYYEMKNHALIRRKLIEMERKYDAEHSNERKYDRF